MRPSRACKHALPVARQACLHAERGAAGSYDLVQDRTHVGRTFRTLNIIDAFTKEALTIRVKRKINSTDVVDALTIARQCIARQCHERGAVHPT